MLMPIRIFPILLLIAACTQTADPPKPAAEVRIQQDGTVSCDHRGFTCWPWLGGDTTCETACGAGYYCPWYEPEETAWCIAHPGQNYHGNPAKPCTKGGDCWWNTACLPGYWR